MAVRRCNCNPPGSGEEHCTGHCGYPVLGDDVTYLAKPVVEPERRCDTPKCPNSAYKLYTIAPGTSVWLCKVCIYRETKGLEGVEEE